MLPRRCLATSTWHHAVHTVGVGGDLPRAGVMGREDIGAKASATVARRARAAADLYIANGVTKFKATNSRYCKPTTYLIIIIIIIWWPHRKKNKIYR